MIVSAASTRRSETPNAVMTTLASRSLGAERLSLWRVEMTSGARGPLHVVDSEQLLTLLEGSAAITVLGETNVLAPGDTAVLPAGADRRIEAVTDTRLLVCGHGDAIVAVPGEAAPRGTPPWIA